MTYAKPEIELLGSANEVIEFQGKPTSNTDASGQPQTGTAPAYDLDE